MRRFLLIGLLIQPLLAAILWAQTDRATITGTVSDSTGALIPGVIVIATNVATGIRTNAVTNQTGIYSLLNLPIGRYTVTFTKEGFQKLERTGINLSVRQVADLSVTLPIGETAIAVTVTDEVPQLQTQTSDVGTTMKAPAVIDLPLDVNGGRSLESFAYRLTPSVQGDSWQSVIAGGQTFSKEVLIDGTSATAQIQGALFETSPSMEAVEEFKVQTSGMGAEAGRSGGGLFMYSMKSGTNDFHGSAFGFLHNEITDANSWWNNFQGVDKGRARFSNIGFSAGGPIIKNKTFIFGAYERFSLNDFRLNQPWATVPTTEFLNGNFGALLDTSTILGTDGAGNAIYKGAIFDPLTGNVFENNVIPADRISSTSRKIVDLYRQHYKPVNSNLIQNNALLLSNSPLQTSSGLSIKIDHNFSDRNKINGSYIARSLPRTLADSGGIWEAGTEDGGPFARSRKQNSGAKSIRLGHTYSFSPTVLNVLNATYNRNRNFSENLATSEIWPTYLGFGDTGVGNFPTINFGQQRNGLWTDGIGNNSAGDGFNGSTFLLNNSLSWVKGRHTLKFGGEFRAMQINSRQVSGPLTFEFSPDQTGAPTTPYSQAVGFGFASFLLGAVDNAQQGTAFNLYGRRKSMGLFVRDDFKVTSRLTLNLGLRWDVTFPFHEKYGHWANFDLNAINPVTGIRGAHVYAKNGDDTFETERDWKEFSPHIGAAFQVSDKFVVRGSYGIFYSPIGIQYWSGVPYAYAPGYRGTNLVSGNADFSPAFYWDNGYPGKFVPGTQDPDFMTWGPVSIDPKSLFAGYTHQFNAGVQFALTKSMTLDVSYVGNFGRRLTGGTLKFNSTDWGTRRALHLSGHEWDWVDSQASADAAGVPYPYQGFSGYAYQAIAPYPQVLSRPESFDGPIIFVGAPLGQSDYSALQVEVTKRSTKGLSMNFSYTIARARSNSINNFGETWWYGGLQDYSNLSREARNLNPWDQKHVFKGAFTYAFPFGKGRKFLSNAGGVLNAFVTGWTVSSIVRYGTGRPLSVFSGNFVPGWAAIYPNINANVGTARKFDESKFNPAVPNNSGNLYFDPAIFENPAPGELGTALASSGVIRGFGDAAEDVRLAKYLYFGADNRFRLSFTFDLYNVFNRHGYGEPVTNMTAPNFGYVTGISGNPRQGQFGARFQW
jgi:Carboxypeptidase regulatory-like domain/TonB dependent receptor